MRNKLGIGTVQFGLNYGVNNNLGKPSCETVESILNYAATENILLIDTARDYGNSEKVIGDYIDKSTSRFNIITKITTKSVKDLHCQINKSLNELRSSEIYGLLFHDFNDFLQNPDLWIAAEKYKNDGVVKKIGFSLYSPNQIDLLINRNIQFDIVQLPFNIFDRRFEAYFELLKKRGVEIHVRSIYLQGLFFMSEEKLPNHFNSIKGKIILLNKIAEKYSLSIDQLCLWFGLAQDYIDKVIIGINCLSDIQKNLSIVLDYKYLPELLVDLNDIQVHDENILLPVNWKL